MVGLTVKTENGIPTGQAAQDLWVIANTTFDIPHPWKEWLGTIRSDEVNDCNIFLLSKKRTATPDVLDDDNAVLKQVVWNSYIGLLLASTFAPAHRPVMLTGARRDDVIDVRQQQDFDSPAPNIFRPYPPVVPQNVQLAVKLGENLGRIVKANLRGGHWRLFRTLHIYTETRTEGDLLSRLHQYCRCIDGLILPSPGETKRQFKSRTELFIGPSYHDLMGEIYDVRSADEHLHENRYLEPFDRDVRLDLVKKEAIVEMMARTALAHILGNASLWEHFANAESLAKFWALPIDDRKKLWGNVINPTDALAEFDPKYIHNGLLGQ